MMRTMLSAVVCAAAMLTMTPISSADGPHPVTTWYFRASYSTGQFNESDDPGETVNLIMPTGSSWRCRRDPVSLTDDGKLMGGFFCGQPASGGQVLINVVCSPSAESSDRASAVISDRGSSAFMRLSAYCATKAPARPAATKPAAAIEKNL